MLTPEQIQSMALSHGFYPDADFTQLVRAIERAAREAAIEECADACEQHQGSTETCASAIRALREGS
jgi:hypothetical protein